MSDALSQFYFFLFFFRNILEDKEQTYHIR